jgi:hypothetical protein
MNSSARSQANWLLLLSVVGTLLLYVVPYGRQIGYPLVLISTLVHELGHGITALLLGGTFQSFQMHADGSGVALVGGYGGRIARALVAAGGLCGPAIAAAVGFVLARRPGRSRWALGAAGALLLLIEVLFVRNLFGLVFVGALAAVLLLIALRGSQTVAQLTLLFLSVQLALSVFSRGDYLFTPVAGGGMPSDVANMASALLLPYWFWGLACALFSLLVLAVGGVTFLRAMPAAPPRRIV